MDSTLQNLNSRIDALEKELDRINYDLGIYGRPLGEAKAAYKFAQSKYHEYKELASQEYNAGQICWELGDKSGAKEHSDKGKYLKAQQHIYGDEMDRKKADYESYLDAYNNKKAEKTGIIEQLKSLRAEKKLRHEELQKQKEAEAAHWHEKTCKDCGKTFRYRDNWSHIPDRCKECRDKDPLLTKKCKECGGEIKYRASWDNPPNYCKACKERFEANTHKGSNEYRLRFKMDEGKNEFFFGTNKPTRWNAHGHVVVDDEGEIHYIRGVSQPFDEADREKETVFDDGFYVGKHAKKE